MTQTTDFSFNLQGVNVCPYPPEEGAICAALVKEIAAPNAWIDKVSAWQALLSVRQTAKYMREEREHLNPSQPQTMGAASGGI